MPIRHRQPYAQPDVGPDAVEVRVRLQNVQVGVHRAGDIFVLLAQAHVVDGTPVAGGGFGVAVVPGIKSVLLDGIEQAHGVLERLAVARGPVEFTQSVEGESEGVNCLRESRGVLSGAMSPGRRYVGLSEVKTGPVAFQGFFASSCRRMLSGSRMKRLVSR